MSRGIFNWLDFSLGKMASERQGIGIFQRGKIFCRMLGCDEALLL